MQVVQWPGDILYLLPHVIHWGINSGINLNETVNIASASWASSGMMAPGRCGCVRYLNCRIFTDSLNLFISFIGPQYYRRCSLVICYSKDDTSFDIAPILRAINVNEERIRNYEAGRLLDLMEDFNFLHPESGYPHSMVIKMENLLGPGFEDVEVSFSIIQSCTR